MLNKILSILSLENKNRIITLQFIIIFSSLLELTSLVSIIPFLGLVTNENYVLQSDFINKIYQLFKFDNVDKFIIFYGFITLFFFMFSTLFLLFTKFKLIKFSESFSIILNNQIYKLFLRKDFYFYIENSSSYILRSLNDDTFRVVNGIIKPSFNLIARGLLVILIITSLLIYNFLVTIILFVILFLTYYLIFSRFRIKIENYGNQLSFFQAKKIKAINESFSSIKDIIVLNKFKYFENYFLQVIAKISKSHIYVNFINISPRYIIDAIGFGFIILFIIILKIYVKEDLTVLLTSVSFLVFAAYKLIPAFQEIYSSLVLLKNNKIALDNILHILSKNQNINNKIKNKKKLRFNKNIYISNINFFYKKNENNKIFINSNFRISKNQSHLILGKSGKGKTTLLEIILGFLTLDNFNLSIDGVENKTTKLELLRNSSTYISQNSILLDESILNNITFGQDKINKKLLEKSLTNSCSKKFITELKYGLDTKVGEKGIILSGGQRQRIIIARALYQNKELMILDEATNALDQVTEDLVLNNLINKLNKTVIIVSHRKIIKEKFDNIYEIKNKKIFKIK